jgi:hypothetical protein
VYKVIDITTPRINVYIEKRLIEDAADATLFWKSKRGLPQRVIRESLKFFSLLLDKWFY